MEKKSSVRGEVIIAGLGGSGVLTAGTLLAEAAVTRYKNVTWFPSYAISKRGGLCECSVIFSDDNIASPLLSQADRVIVTEAAQFRDFKDRVRPGGTMVVEKTGLEAKAEAKDIRVIEIPAIKTAISLGGTSRGANLVLLGALVEESKVISAELIEQQIKKTYAQKKSVQKANLEAFQKGRNLAQTYVGKT